MDLTSSFSNLSVDCIQSKVNSFAASICGNHTEFVITNFPNSRHILITQFGKIGNLYQVRIDQPENGLSITNPVYTITSLIGAENIEAEVAARYLTEKLKIQISLLLCLSLRNYNRDTLNAIIQAIQEYHTSNN